jgi:hypothetical protein
VLLFICSMASLEETTVEIFEQLKSCNKRKQHSTVGGTNRQGTYMDTFAALELILTTSRGANAQPV